MMSSLRVHGKTLLKAILTSSFQHATQQLIPGLFLKIATVHSTRAEVSRETTFDFCQLMPTFALLLAFNWPTMN